MTPVSEKETIRIVGAPYPGPHSVPVPLPARPAAVQKRPGRTFYRLACVAGVLAFVLAMAYSGVGGLAN